MFGDVNAESGYLDSNGDIVSGSGWLYTANYIPVKPSTTYAFTPNSTSGGFPKHIYYDKNKAIISTIASGPKIFTTPSNCAFMRFSYRNSSFDIQLEQGNTATEYAPYYNGGTATTEMLLKVGNYQDEQEILSGAITRNVGVLVLDGTEGWTKSSAYIGSFFSNSVYPAKPKQTGNPNVLCSHGFKVGDLGEYSAAQPGACYWYAPTTLNYKYDDGTATVAQFTQWLANQYAAGTPVIVIYPLATPTTESGTGQTLQVTGGDNVLEITQASLDGLELEAEYEKGAE